MRLFKVQFLIFFKTMFTPFVFYGTITPTMQIFI